MTIHQLVAAQRLVPALLFLCLLIAAPSLAQDLPSNYRVLSPSGFPLEVEQPRPGKSAGADYLRDVAPDGLFCWPEAKLPIKVYFQPAREVAGFRQEMPGILASCFDEWSQASAGKLGWKQVFDPARADVVVRWTNHVTERAEGTEAGHTKTYGELNTITNRGIIKKAEMLLLTRLPERPFTDTEIRRSYLHECGHAFGIIGHSHDRRDVMYYAVSDRESPRLGARDVATINHLYAGYKQLGDNEIAKGSQSSHSQAAYDGRMTNWSTTRSSHLPYRFN